MTKTTNEINSSVKRQKQSKKKRDNDRQTILDFDPSSSSPHLHLTEELIRDENFEHIADSENEDQDIDLFEQPDLTQASASIREYATSYRGEDIEVMAQNLVRLALATSAKKQLLRREDINKILDDNRRSFYTVLQRAQEYLRGIMGMELVQTTLRERSTSINPISRIVASSTTLSAPLSQMKLKNNKAYVLVSILDKDLRSIAINYKKKRFHMVLICIILCLIRFSGDVLHKDHLYSYLEKLGLDLNENEEPYGSIDSVISLFVRQAYLDKTKVISQDVGIEVCKYKWGPRAMSELSDNGIIMFVKHIYDAQDNETGSHLESELRRLLNAER